MTSSTLTHLYIDVHSVSTPNSSKPITTNSPSADKYARVLVFELGRRRHQGKNGRGGRGGAGSLVTPYWVHKLARMMLAILPASKIEELAVQTVTKTKIMLEQKCKRTE